MMLGRISTFGGNGDPGMRIDEGLALYEHHEADGRPDLFLPRPVNALAVGTSQRLRPGALYLAVRFDKAIGRARLQWTPWALRNPRNGLAVVASLVDWGPHERTGRTFDISPSAAAMLAVNTDDTIEGWPLE